MIIRIVLIYVINNSIKNMDKYEILSDYIAHIRDDGSVQTIREHLEGVAELAAGFADDFDAADQGRLVGMLWRLKTGICL